MSDNRLYVNITNKDKSCRINLCNSWISIHNSLKKIGIDRTLYDIHINDSDLSISLDTCRGKIFDELSKKIKDDDRLADIHLLCKRIEYGDKEFSDMLSYQLDTYSSIDEINQDYVDFTTYKYNHLNDEQKNAYLSDYLNRNFEVIQLFGKTVLFTGERIPRKNLPSKIYRYEVREDDDGKGMMAQLAESIMINHWGTILSNHPIKLGGDGYLDIDEAKDVEYPLCPYVTLKQYMAEYKAKKIEFSR